MKSPKLRGMVPFLSSPGLHVCLELPDSETITTLMSFLGNGPGQLDVANMSFCSV